MNWQDVVSNVKIYGLEESVKGAEEVEISQEEQTVFSTVSSCSLISPLQIRHGFRRSGIAFSTS